MTANTTTDEYYTCDIDRSANKFIIANGVTNFDLNLNVSSDTSVGNVIGFGISTSFTGSDSYTGINLLNLNATNALFIGSTQISANAIDSFIASNGLSDIINSFDVGGIFGNIINSRSLTSLKINNATFTNIEFELFDRNGNEIILPTDDFNSYFTITLDIYSGIFDLTYYD